MRAQSRGGCRHRLRWPARRAAWLLPLHLPEQPEHDRPQRLVLLAVDQQLGEGACYRVPPELADSVGSLENDLRRGRASDSFDPALTQLGRFAAGRPPGTLFVARFIGESNLWEGTVGRRAPDGVRFVTASGLDLLVEDAAGAAEGERAVASVRPEAVAIAPAGAGATARFPNRVEGTVEDASYVGASTAFRVRIGPVLTVLVRRPNMEGDAEGARGAFSAGNRVTLEWPASASRVIRPA